MSCWDGFGPPHRDEDWEDSDDADESWRGDQHFDDWPEDLAGPEYWLNKEQGDEDKGGGS